MARRLPDHRDRPHANSQSTVTASPAGIDPGRVGSWYAASLTLSALGILAPLVGWLLGPATTLLAPVGGCLLTAVAVGYGYKVRDWDLQRGQTILRLSSTGMIWNGLAAVGGLFYLAWRHRAEFPEFP